jgi:hypothetical protein
MLYDSNGFKPYIFFDFHNLSMYHTHTHMYIYILLALRKIYWISSCRAVFEVSGTTEAVFTLHVWPLPRTYLVSWTCLAPGLTCLGLGFPSYIKGTPYPMEP